VNSKTLRLRVPVWVGIALMVSAMCAGAGWGATAPGGASWDTTSPSGASWGSLPPSGASWDTRPAASVVVRAKPGSLTRVLRDVRVLGGTVDRQLRIINGFSAKVPASALPRLRLLPGVFSVTRNTRLEAMGATYSAASDYGSMYNTTLMSGAQAYWKAGFTGKGVDVALIDSGVVPVDGLTFSGKLLNGPDLSFESQATNLRYLDTFGHGTHMAGIIAGRGSRATATSKFAGDTTNFLGMAPEARIISIKVADSQGATDVSQVIAAIDWVVQHAKDTGFNIRVINLSYGTDGTQDYRLDPLAFAAEQAKKAGILVVAAAGNDGSASQGTMTNPAYDPHVFAVGAADSKNTTTLTDDFVPSYSSSGSNASSWKSRDPDMVAPGTHIVSLRAPGSYIDQTYGSTGAVTSTLFRGSGTSQAAAVMSGAAALVIQQRPTITPDQLKQLLMSTAQKISGSTTEQGYGELNLTKALSTPTPSYTNPAAYSTGTGTLELSRGTGHLVASNGVALAGEQDIFGMPFNSAAMATLEANGSSWSGGTWNGSSWSGSSWSGSSWSGSSWSGSSWSGNTWSSRLWSGAMWK
jgi:serine protease AprX